MFRREPDLSSPREEAFFDFRRFQLIFEVTITGPPSVMLCRSSTRDGRIGSRAALTVSNLRQYFRYTSILTPFCSQTIIGKKILFIKTRSRFGANISKTRVESSIKIDD